MGLYSDFLLDLNKEFKDIGYGWSKAKEPSCDWIISRLPNGAGVDVGGTAYLVKKIQENSKQEITFFDFFPPADSGIKKHIAADMAEFGKYFAPNSLDFITTRHTLEHSLNPLFQLWQYNRALKDKGTLIVIVPQHSTKWVWFFSHFNCLPLENWLMLFERAGFAVKETTAGTWQSQDPQFVEYRFVLQVVRRGISMNNLHPDDPETVRRRFAKLLDGDVSYFEDLNEEALRRDVFPYNPELFNVIARRRGMGIPGNYQKIVDSYPVDQQMVFFESNLGKQYSGNPRYIYERMQERYPGYTYIWCYEGATVIPGNPLVVKRGSEDYYKYLARSRVIVNNASFPLWFHRAETFYFQTWRGTPFKLLHWDLKQWPIEKRSSCDFFVKSTGWDALLSPNPYSTRKFISAFKYEGEIVEFGYPANDIFYNREKYEAVRNRVRAELGITDTAQVFLYAPAWRDGVASSKTGIQLDPSKFLEKAPSDAVLLVRIEHVSDALGVQINISDRVMDVSRFDDIAELMCAADVLIADYSSDMFDWYCSKKPVLYYVPDYEEYVGTKHGSYFDLLEKNAGVICNNETELYNAMKVVLSSTFNEVFYAEFCGLHDGNSADRVVNYLIARMAKPNG